MGVLDVIDRVLARLLARELDVELDRAVVRSLEHEEPGRVDADLVEQVVEHDEVAAALGHRGYLAALDEVDELQQRELDRVGIAPERLHRRLHRAHVGRVVGPDRYELELEPALALVVHVGDVRSEVGGLAVGADDHPVLVVAEARRPQPHRALGVVDVADLLEPRQRALQLARGTLVERSLAEENVEPDPVAIERRLDLGQQQVDRAPRQLVRRSRPPRPGISDARSATYAPW